MLGSPLDITEILYMVIYYVPATNLTFARRVSKFWRGVVDMFIQDWHSKRITEKIADFERDRNGGKIMNNLLNGRQRMCILLQKLSKEQLVKLFTGIVQHEDIRVSMWRRKKNVAVYHILKYVELFGLDGLNPEHFKQDLLKSITTFANRFVLNEGRFDKKCDWYVKRKRVVQSYTRYWEASRVMCQDIILTEKGSETMMSCVTYVFHNYMDFRTALALDDIITNWQYKDNPRREVDYNDWFWRDNPDMWALTAVDAFDLIATLYVNDNCEDNCGKCDGCERAETGRFLQRYRQIQLCRRDKQTQLELYERLWVPEHYFLCKN